jgi:uncharacterized protein (UPF0305 family)
MRGWLKKLLYFKTNNPSNYGYLYTNYDYLVKSTPLHPLHSSRPGVLGEDDQFLQCWSALGVAEIS